MSDDDRETTGRRPGDRPKPAGGSRAKQSADETLPPAGPHARPDLTDEEKTPGTGMLPEPDDANPSPTG